MLCDNVEGWDEEGDGMVTFGSAVSRVVELDCVGSWEARCIGVRALEGGVGTPF